MINETVVLLLVLSLSGILQFVAAAMAIRLIRPSGFFSAWVLLACGFLVQGIRRIVALIHVLGGQSQGDMMVEFLDWPSPFSCSAALSRSNPFSMRSIIRDRL